MAEIKKQIDGRRPDDLVFGTGADYLPRPKSNGGWFAGAVDSLVKNAKLSKHWRKQCIWHEQAEGWACARPRPGRWTTRIYTPLDDDKLLAKLTSAMPTARARPENAVRHAPAGR
jgi:hypothetical protein